MVAFSQLRTETSIGAGGGGTVRVIIDGGAVIVDGAAVTVLVLVLTLVLGAEDRVLLQPTSASPTDPAAMRRVMYILGFFSRARQTVDAGKYRAENGCEEGSFSPNKTVLHEGDAQPTVTGSPASNRSSISREARTRLQHSQRGRAGFEAGQRPRVDLFAR